MRRRSFLKTVGGAAAGSTLGVPAVAGGRQKDTAGLPRRALGRTGLKASIVTFPGLALVHGDQQEGTKVLHDAFRRGVNYFDVAPAYGKGDAEIKMGIGLEGIDRSKYVLACKTKMRDKKGAREELQRSLKRLKTDHFDVYQLHCLIRPEEVDEALAPGGAMEAILEAVCIAKLKEIQASPDGLLAQADHILSDMKQWMKSATNAASQDMRVSLTTVLTCASCVTTSGLTRIWKNED